MGRQVRWIAVGGAVAAVALVWAFVNGQGDEDTGPVPRQPAWVRVVVGPRLVSGANFDVRYETVDPNETERLTPPVALTLFDGDEAINTLLAAGSSRIQTPHTPNIPAIRFHGPGPFTFPLPRLKPGHYTLCGNDITVEDLSRPRERFCRRVEVVQRTGAD